MDNGIIFNVFIDQQTYMYNKYNKNVQKLKTQSCHKALTPRFKIIETKNSPDRKHKYLIYCKREKINIYAVTVHHIK